MNPIDRLTRRGRVRTLAIWAASALAVYAVLGFLVAPPIVRSQLERVLAGQLGRPVTIERVRINPFSLSASIRGFALKTRDGGENAFTFDELYVDLASSSLFRLAPVVESVRLSKPTVRFVRYEDKSYNFQDIVDRFANRPPSPPGPPPRFAVYNIVLADGRVEIDDRPEKARHVVSDLQIGIPFISSLPSQVDINVQPRLTARVNGTEFDLGGETKPLKDTRETRLRIDIDDLQIGKYLEYSPVPLRVKIPSGGLTTRLELALSTQDEKLSTLTLSGSVRLQKFAAQKADGAPLIAIEALNVDIDAIDFINRRAAIRSVRVDAPKVDVIRGKDGGLNWAALAPESKPSEPAEPKNEAPFPFSVGDIALARGSVRVIDEGPDKPFRLALDNIALSLEGLGNAAGTKAAARLACDTGGRGRLAYDGSLELTPLRTSGKLDVANLQLGAFAPYIEEKLRVIIGGGALSTKGQLSYESREDGPRIGYRADASVANFATLDEETSQDLLRWKQLAVRGIDFELTPLKVAVGEVALSDFYSRLIVNPDGTLNLQGLSRQPARADAAPAKPDAQTSPSGPPANVRLGKVVLRNGNVNFSDFFIKPNYSVALSGVEGAVSEMTPDRPGDVELHGRIHQTAPLEIVGQVNSLSKDLFVDMKASVKDIDLPPVTPYSVKYTGYGIQKGKLSVKVAYHIENRRLAAQNNVTLDQLTFGERVESPTATTLPVLFAVALMKDSNGVIDVDLPISGSLDDPQFSVGGIIAKALVNLVTKAVTAPFALLGALVGGGGEELAFVEYAPGSSALSAEDEAKLRTLSKALTERPALKVEVSGRVDADADREALKRAAVDREIKLAKLKDVGGTKGQAVDEVAIAPEEHDKYLTAAYKDAKFDRPRNAIGLLKDLPVPEMERLMLANAPVREDDLRQLAFARAGAPKEWLVENGKIAADRVFIVAPKMSAEGIKDPGKPTRADFSLK
ncbi:MAG TPA: DUF748 domain-containing protein [Burkholderiales bacterium]|nr:DUF748 domain-containing protein [Burkholderiales bacterium]